MPAFLIHPANSPQAARATTGMPTLPRLSEQGARLGRMVGRGCFTRLAEMPAVLSLRPAHDDAGAGAPWPDALVLGSAAGPLELADGARLIHGLTGIHPGQAQAHGAQRQWFAAALAGRLAATPFAGMHLGAPPASTPVQERCCLRLTLRSRSHMLSGLARASAAAWLDFLTRSAWTLERAPASHWFAAEHRAALCIAQHTLPGGVLRALAPGDVIVPDSPRFGTDGAGRMLLANLHIQVRYAAPDSIAILDVENMNDH